jgi:hypothetical protein
MNTYLIFTRGQTLDAEELASGPHEDLEGPRPKELSPQPTVSSLHSFR